MKIYIDVDACPVTRIAERVAKVAQRKSKNRLKGPAKRTEEDGCRFEESFQKLIESCKEIPHNRVVQ